VKIGVKELLTGGKQRRMLKSRSVLCYWGDVPYYPNYLDKAEGIDKIIWTIEYSIISRNAELQELIQEKPPSAFIIEEIKSLNRDIIQELKAHPSGLF
jgi:hypothetical protein